MCTVDKQYFVKLQNMQKYGLMAKMHASYIYAQNGKKTNSVSWQMTNKYTVQHSTVQYNMHWLSYVFILVTLHLQHITCFPAAFKQQRQQAAQMMDWNDIIKLDFSPHGIKKELNLDMGLFALRSKQSLKFGVEEQEEDTLERRKRAVNALPAAAPCYSKGGMGTGGGSVDYGDVAGRSGASKKSKVAAKAKSMLNKLKKKKKFVSERSRRDVQDIGDKAGELMQKARNSFMSFFNKMRKFSEDIIERIKD